MGAYAGAARCRIHLATIHLLAIAQADARPDGQTEAYLTDTGMTGVASAWVMARRRMKEYRCNMDAATRCSGVCPPYLT